MGIVSQLVDIFISFFTIYKTPKIVQVKNKKVAILNRLIQLFLFTYVIVFMIVLKKGYQVSSPVESAVITKIKGIAEVDLTKNPNLNEKFNKSKLHYYDRVWDGQDLVFPPKEVNGFFLTSNLIITKDQTLGTCPDLSSKPCDEKKAPKQCLDAQSVLSDGVNTGRCLRLDESSNKTVCEIKGWCPAEDDTLPLKDNYPIFEQIQNFTVLIKNTIRFPLFNVLKRNIEESADTNDYLKTCLFHPTLHPRCPIFKIGDIIEYAETNFTEIARLGGVIGIQINWRCDLDWDLSYCFPSYTFTRIDREKALVSPGYNFRYSRYYLVNDVETRDLFKAYGIKFEILTSGAGSKFSALQLAISIGSGIGLLTITVVICDIILLYFTSDKEVYNKKKFLYVIENNQSIKKNQTVTYNSTDDIE